jgi:DNA-binding transcriptional LysR family regulator
MDCDRVEELQFEPLADEHHAVVAGAAHPLATKRSLTLADLVGQTWVLPRSGSVLRDRLLGVFVEMGLAPPTNLVETTSVPVITSLLRESDMVAVMAPDVVQPYCQAGVLKVLIPSLNVPLGLFGIITHRNRQISPGAQVLLAALRETAANLYSQPLLRAASGGRR